MIGFGLIELGVTVPPSTHPLVVLGAIITVKRKYADAELGVVPVTLIEYEPY